MVMQGPVALPEFIIQRQKEFLGSTGAFSRILRDIGLSAKIINRVVNKAGLIDVLGSTDETNIHGEQIQKLDRFANEKLIASFFAGGQCCAVASEENEDIVTIPGGDHVDRRYVVAIDPLDGSSNIDVNVSVGTIFSILARDGNDEACTAEDFLQPGIRQLAAGYIVYGSSTMLVYTTGRGVNGFTLDPSIGEFILSHPDMKIPESGKLYSVNMGNYNRFSEGVRRFIDYCQQEDKVTGRPYSLRYVGSMVADVHRTLIRGGIFMYPATHTSPHGKLRLLYEANPMAFIIEQAGGMASDGTRRIMEIEPHELHQRVPVFMGSKSLVEKAEEMIGRYG